VIGSDASAERAPCSNAGLVDPAAREPRVAQRLFRLPCVTETFLVLLHVPARSKWVDDDLAEPALAALIQSVYAIATGCERDTPSASQARALDGLLAGQGETTASGVEGAR
jgi:hypothetical protein